jgi:putative FmdB family regulatory protein
MTDYFMRAICFDATTATLSIGFRIQYIGTIMPNYEYECPGEESVIILQLPMDHKTPNCQVCGSAMRRVYTAVPFILKGTGWAGKDG